jgi:hypothetical protein
MLSSTRAHRSPHTRRGSSPRALHLSVGDAWPSSFPPPRETIVRGFAPAQPAPTRIRGRSEKQKGKPKGQRATSRDAARPTGAHHEAKAVARCCPRCAARECGLAGTGVPAFVEAAAVGRPATRREHGPTDHSAGRTPQRGARNPTPRRRRKREAPRPRKPKHFTRRRGDETELQASPLCGRPPQPAFFTLPASSWTATGGPRPPPPAPFASSAGPRCRAR